MSKFLPPRPCNPTASRWGQTLLARLLTTPVAGSRRRAEHGQATAEYALVLLGAAAIALVVVSWVAKTNLVGSLLDSVFTRLLRGAR